MSGPLVPPPPGYTYLGRNGESYGPHIVAAGSVTIAFAIIVYALRVCVKAIFVGQVRKFRIEDYLVTVALICAIARTALQFTLVDRYQFGQHIWDYETANLDKWLVIQNAALLIYLFAIACAKTAMLSFYIRLFGINQMFKWICYGLIFITVGYCVAFILAVSFACKPISSFWTSFVAYGQAHCINQPSLSVVTGGFNIATDFLIVILPIPLIVRLHMPVGEMLGILAVFSTGAIVVAVAIVRQVMIVGVATKSTDFTWVSAQIDMWLTVELNVGVIGACLPALAPIRRKIGSAYSSIVSLVRTGSRSSSSIEDEEAVYMKRESVRAASDSSERPSGIIHTQEVDISFVEKNETEGHNMSEKYGSWMSSSQTSER